MSPTGAMTASRSSLATAAFWPPLERRERARDSSTGPPSRRWTIEGYIYVADWGNERVQLLAPDGAFLQSLRGEATVSKWAQEFLDVNPDESTTRDQSNLVPDLPSHLSTPYLISTQTEPYFWGPASVTLDADGRLYVTESSRHRVQVYQQNRG